MAKERRLAVIEDDTSVVISDSTHLSIAEARRLMGKGGEVMTNEEVERTVYNLTAIARAYVKASLVPKYEYK